ncbi:SpoIID/LytB domain-containing protein [bacterium]|nr:SpoIID/LytB domain-containing protein [bacterium]
MDKIIRNFQSEPLIRIYLTGGKDVLDFCTAGKFKLFHDYGDTIINQFCSNLKWRIQLESYEPAQFIYTLLVDTFKVKSDAEHLVQQLYNQGLEARIQQYGGLINLDGNVLTNNTEYRILIGEFNSFDDARSFGWQIDHAYNGEIIQEKIRDSRGILELFDEEYEYTYRLNNGLKLVPCNMNAEMILYQLQESHRRDKKLRLSRWPVSFHVGDCGGIVVVCEIALETYLKGVIQDRIGEYCPVETMKSQAVASRSWILSNLGLRHIHAPYDFCGTDHCQLFQSRAESVPDIEKAIKETHGEVLLFDYHLCETPTTYHCGGHTEGKSTISYLKGIFDRQNGDMDEISLDNEDHVTSWIHSQPDVYCNLGRLKNADWIKQIDSALRWEVSYPRKKLEKIIQKKTGEDIGTLFDIIPAKRGISGRLVEIELLGSRKNIQIKGDQLIRETLSESILNSSCFIIETDMGNNGIPLSFSFIGAGSGHGIGLCHTGAVAMAFQGQTYSDILYHYYKGVQLKKIY